MSEKTERAPKTNWFKGLASEFKKIIWPDGASLVRQTVAVVIVSVIVGLIIAGLDWVIHFGIDKLITLSI